ncbi:hypothetical protein [Actinomadura sp. 9N407]|uniref:hypothetical protein n=1 Tax=Actinomadura sp. 9N407 TaxID=3375154 RepID=UPI00378BA902
MSSKESEQPNGLDEVDVHPDVHRATEEDEEQVLRALYGEPDEDGIYRGEEI